ncbi:guanylate kinase [Vaccinia virus]|nr:guanylate kinase [Vaccinia virus]
MSGIVKSIILSGPSGSGKTAIAKRLWEYIWICGVLYH